MAMGQNLFEELHNKKQQLITLINKAVKYHWIDSDREKQLLDKVENDTLTIGVIGQMKCGKSTFLNSFVFKNDILPSATTPMTAALSVITYGEKEKIEAEFYTKDEWVEQKMMVTRSLDEVRGNTLEESKIKAAKELVEKANKLGTSLESFLGKIQEDSFSNLIEYVGADGKYISITKSVTIYYPKEYLRGVQIVDTPGFNDPVVSREERTKAFLNKADVVLLMLYAGRPFDATDRDILFQNVRKCGIGKVLMGINKYDIPYENGETEDEIKEYVRREINKACEECNEESLKEILKQAEPVTLSAEMALLSELSMSKISSNDAYQFAWNRACDVFGISSQPQMREKSHINDLSLAIKRMIETEKGSILFQKPLNAIKAIGNEKLSEIDNLITMCKNLIGDLNKPDDELQEKEENLDRAERRLLKKIDSLGDDIDSEFRNIIRKGRYNMEDEVDATCRSMLVIIGDWGRFSNVDSIIPKLDAEKQKLITRTLKREVESLSDMARSKVKDCLTEFLNNVDDILFSNIPDFDSRDFLKSVSKEIQMELQNEDMFTFDNSSDDEDEFSWGIFIGDCLFGFLNGYCFGALELAKRAFTHDNIKKELEEHINSISGNFDPMPFLGSLYENKEKIIESVKQKIIVELINPMQQQIDDIRTKFKDKKKALEDAQEKLKILEREKQGLSIQVNEINQISF